MENENIINETEYIGKHTRPDDEAGLEPDDKNENKSEKKPEKQEPSFLKSLLIDVLIAAIIAGGILFFIRPTVVKQTSMLDTFQPNDYVIVYKRAYSGAKTPQRGDVIIFQSELVNEETGGDKLLIKRVIGLPGDTIRIEDSQVYLNGEMFEEDYIKDGYTPAIEIPLDGETFTVPEDHYYCMGDNRVVSVDSRYSEVGCVTEEQIMGKAVLRLFPFNKIQTF